MRACFGLKAYGGIRNNFPEERSIYFKIGIEALLFEVSFFLKGAIKG